MNDLARSVVRALLPKKIRARLFEARIKIGTFPEKISVELLAIRDTIWTFFKSPGLLKKIVTWILPEKIRLQLFKVKLQLFKKKVQLFRIWTLLKSPGLLKRVGRVLLRVACGPPSRWALRLSIRLGRYCSRRRIATGEVRSLWGVTPILTLPLKARADRCLGFKSESIVYTTYVITEGFDRNLSNAYRKAAAYGLVPEFQRLVLAHALLRYDVFHTFADRGLLDSKGRWQIDQDELAIWKAAGKRVYVYAYGADVRTREKTLALGRWNFCVDCTEPTKYCTCIDAENDAYMSRISRLVTAMVSLGDMLVYMPGVKHVNYWPIDIDRLKPGTLRDPQGPLRIGHAPNHTHFKGSHYLEKVIERLKSQGHQIDYVKIQGVPNTQVLDLFRSCDLIADQFIGGAYGYTALEGMALGRPVISYVRSPALLEAADECPLFDATPDILEEVLTWILKNRDKLPAIGAQGCAYVQRWHSIEAVASRMGALYRETADFPRAVLEKFDRQRGQEVRRRDSIPVAVGWEHPYRVGCHSLAAGAA